MADPPIRIAESGPIAPDEPPSPPAAVNRILDEDGFELDSGTLIAILFVQPFDQTDLVNDVDITVSFQVTLTHNDEGVSSIGIDLQLLSIPPPAIIGSKRLEVMVDSGDSITIPVCVRFVRTTNGEEFTLAPPQVRWDVTEWAGVPGFLATVSQIEIDHNRPIPGVSIIV